MQARANLTNRPAEVYSDNQHNNQQERSQRLHNQQQVVDYSVVPHLNQKQVEVFSDNSRLHQLRHRVDYLDSLRNNHQACLVIPRIPKIPLSLANNSSSRVVVVCLARAARIALTMAILVVDSLVARSSNNNSQVVVDYSEGLNNNNSNHKLAEVDYSVALSNSSHLAAVCLDRNLLHLQVDLEDCLDNHNLSKQVEDCSDSRNHQLKVVCLDKHSHRAVYSVNHRLRRNPSNPNNCNRAHFHKASADHHNPRIRI